MSDKITVYEKPTCTTCRNLAELLKENGIGYEMVNYYIDPLSEEKLCELLEKANLKAFDILRKKEPLFKELNISEDTPSDEIIKLIIKNPNLLQRPIVEVGDKAVLARPIEKAIELINSIQ
ncbi:MAG: arsenate reductase [Acidobacteriota bacterium]|nr:arsenate reductase [Acidobacteriota bacterium]